MDERWIGQLSQLDKQKEEHMRVSEVLGKDNDIVELAQMLRSDQNLYENLKSTILTLSKKISNVKRLFVTPELDVQTAKRTMYIYVHIFSYILHALVQTVSQAENVFDLSEVSIMSTLNTTIR